MYVKFSVNMMFACTRFRPTGWGWGARGGGVTLFCSLSLHGNNYLNGEVSLFGTMLDFFRRMVFRTVCTVPVPPTEGGGFICVREGEARHLFTRREQRNGNVC